MPLALIVIVAISAIAGLLFFVFPNKQSSTEQPRESSAEYTGAIDREVDSAVTQKPAQQAQPITTDTSSITDAIPAEKNTYSNGTHTANATYFTPKRVQHNISVSVTIHNDVITAANVLYDNAEAKTPSHIGFDGAYEQVVLGVEIDDLDLARVGGASLTTTAFNKALTDIASDASL